MLVTAVDQLTFMANEKHYREAANLVDAVRQVRVTDILLLLMSEQIPYILSESDRKHLCLPFSAIHTFRQLSVHNQDCRHQADH